MNAPRPYPELSRLFQALARSKFRSRFELAGRDLAYLTEKGLGEVMQHAHNFLATRLFPAQIANDGRQTPMRGHPVFVAQHATATCCRQCLAKWHGISPGRHLGPGEQDYVLGVLRAWLEKQDGAAGPFHSKQPGFRQGTLSLDHVPGVQELR